MISEESPGQGKFTWVEKAGRGGECPKKAKLVEEILSTPTEKEEKDGTEIL